MSHHNFISPQFLKLVTLKSLVNVIRLGEMKTYVFGYFCASYWRLSPDITGDRLSALFSL